MHRNIINLRTALFGFVFLGALIPGGVTLLVLQDQLIDFRDAALERAVRVRGQGVALDLSRSLERDWRALAAVAQMVDPRHVESVTISAEGLVGDGQRIAWAGYAELDGRIVAASGDRMVGADISGRAWFQRGLEGAFAGDVRDEILLNRLLGGTVEEPVSFLDFSTPVTDRDGAVLGVLALHLNFDATRAYLAETAQTQGIDLFLVNQHGTVIFASDGSVATSLELPSMHAARVGVQVSGIEVWPNGGTYVTTVIPQVQYGDLPSFGWRMVARIEPRALGNAVEALSRTILTLLAAAAAVLLAMTLVFYRQFLAPIHRLAHDATQIAEGEDLLPAEHQSSREAAILAAALVRLQHRDG